MGILFWKHPVYCLKLSFKLTKCSGEETGPPAHNEEDHKRALTSSPSAQRRGSQESTNLVFQTMEPSLRCD